MLAVGGEIALLVRVGGQIVKLLRRAPAITLHDGCGGCVRFRRVFPRCPIAALIEFAGKINVRSVKEFRVQIQDVFPTTVAQTAHWIYIPAPIAAVGCKNLVAMRIAFAAQHGKK